MGGRGPCRIRDRNSLEEFLFGCTVTKTNSRSQEVYDGDKKVTHSFVFFPFKIDF